MPGHDDAAPAADDSNFPIYTVDDPLLEAAARTGQGRLVVYRAASLVVVLGRGSRADVEVDLAACAADGVPVQRRRGGGCAVVLDPGNCIVSLALPIGGFANSRLLLDRLSGWLIDGLAAAGFGGLRREGICDLVRGDRKVGGACLYRRRDALLYSASLLAAPRIELLGRYLRHPPREPAYRRGRTHADFVTSLGAPDAGAFAARLALTLRCPEVSAG